MFGRGKHVVATLKDFFQIINGIFFTVYKHGSTSSVTWLKNLSSIGNLAIEQVKNESTSLWTNYNIRDYIDNTSFFFGTYEWVQ